MSRERSSHRSGAHRIATTLGPDARALLEAARGGDDPSPSDRARMRHALMSAIAGATVTTAAASASAASVLGSASAGSVTSGAASAGGASIVGTTTAVGATSLSGLFGVPLAMKAAVLVIAASATGALAFGVTNLARPQRDAASQSPIATPARTAVTSTRSIAEPAPPIDTMHDAPAVPAPAALVPATTPRLEIEPLTSPRQAPARPRDSAARRSAPALDTAAIAVPAPVVSTLADEMALIRTAWADLRAGRGDDALASLDAHQSRFPEGALAPERDAARAIALCASTRREEGQRAASSFLRAHPRSPLAARVRDACR